MLVPCPAHETVIEGGACVTAVQIVLREIHLAQLPIGCGLRGLLFVVRIIEILRYLFIFFDVFIELIYQRCLLGYAGVWRVTVETHHDWCQLFFVALVQILASTHAVLVAPGYLKKLSV
jgi:hypothetical protein